MCRTYVITDSPKCIVGCESYIHIVLGQNNSELLTIEKKIETVNIYACLCINIMSMLCNRMPDRKKEQKNHINARLC